jgi:mannan polymerase II complex MNN11 subunit
VSESPSTWAKVPALRHAMAKYRHSKYFWFIDQNSLIMNPDITIESIVDPKRIDALMMKDQPVVPPDSVIRTFGHLRGEKIDLLLTQDTSGLAPSSFILRRGDWADYFLDAWFDPLYRSYNFQKAEVHALVCLWHSLN